MQRRKLMILAGLAASTSALTACGGGDGNGIVIPAPRDIVQLAQGTPDLSILIEAVIAADLVATLKAPGPLTVLAPTNAAFVSLLAELNLTKAQLLANKPLLVAVLTYHVIPSELERAQIRLGRAITSAQGGIFKVELVSNVLTITDGRNRNPKIVAADLLAFNGVVHVVDKVLLPADKNILQTAQALPQFSILVEAVVAANLQDTLSGPRPFTLFAPTNDAFAALLTELGITKAALLANTALLTNVLTYHMLSGRLLKADIRFGVATGNVSRDSFLVNEDLTITDQRGRSSKIVLTDMLTSNGVIHVIDKVILPRP